jgi:hypothetical protein
MFRLGAAGSRGGRRAVDDDDDMIFDVGFT